MKIYIACLAAYNNGMLHGEWIEPSSDVEELSEHIKTILKKSPAPDAEEWAVHDYDDFPNMGEYASLNDICEWVELVEEFSEHEPYLKDVYENYHNIEDTKKYLEDAFSGYESFEDYANERADEDLACHGIKDNHPLIQYFDYNKHEQSLSHEYTVFDHPSKKQVLIIHNY